jgi:chemotaxis protein CheD
VTIPMVSHSLPYHFLKPGELIVAEEPCIISTLLGSCVAVTMVSRRIGFGAICHALLPSCAEGNGCDCTERFRHVECSIRGMIEAFRDRGVPCSGIEAKVFGGADMFRSGSGADGRATVGRQNVARANLILAAEGIRIAAFDVGGRQGRKIFFYTQTGDVYLRRLSGMAFRQASLSPGRPAGVPL